MQATFAYVRFQRQNSAVGEDLEKLKQRLPLLDYLRQQNPAQFQALLEAARP